MDALALLVEARVRGVTVVAEGVMSAERQYAAALLASLANPSADVAGWLMSPAGPPPVELDLLVSLLKRTAVRLAELGCVSSDGAP